MKKNMELDWANLGFDYIRTDQRYISYWNNGQWDDGALTEDNVVHISEGSTALHYGQTVFEGMKAYRAKDGSINLFRPEENAKRMQRSCRRLLMPVIPTDVFIEAVKKVVKANEAYIPPYGTGGSLYLRPYIIGIGDNIGVKPAESYLFSIFCMPVGAYFKNGLVPTNFLVSEYDRAAGNGTGASKVGGNYGGSLLPGSEARERNFADAIYLDPITHTKIEEVGAANFFGITKDNQFITPLSPSILPSITKYSLLYLAENRLGLKVKEEEVFIDHLDRFTEAGACGTAAIITPIGGIQYKEDFHVFYSETEIGPVTKKLYKELTSIQYGEIEAPEGWIVKV